MFSFHVNFGVLGKSGFGRLIIFFVFFNHPDGRAAAQVVVNVADGWARNSVNTVVFRKNSIVSFKGFQIIAFYNDKQQVVLGKRKIGEKNWELNVTAFTGRIRDAHNAISIMIDGDGFLHMAWDHHNNRLNYARSLAPLSLDMGAKMEMTGKNESSVSYPEFYRMPDGGLLFLYRDGGSGRGNLVVDRYDLPTRTWKQLHQNLIDGEGKRNAYWQACVDNRGTIHISWVWRESPDASSNHDLCYARSRDGGVTWERSDGKTYSLPVNAANAEYAFRIPQKSELINQTSMTADKRGRPYIATYWRDQQSDVPQYRLVFQKSGRWHAQNLAFRHMPFTLSGGGTRRIPISRPQVLYKQSVFSREVIILFRDEERGNRVSVAIKRHPGKNVWQLKDILDEDTGSWEPSYDTELWKRKKLLHLFVQKTEQADAEGSSSLPPQMVKVLEVKL
jgi:hypothetical protein